MSLITRFKDAVSVLLSTTGASIGSSRTEPANALYNYIDSLNGRWFKKQTQGRTEEYIGFGSADDFPKILDKMRSQSPIHSGILTKKAKMVYGNDLTASIGGTNMKAFMRHAGGEGVSLHSVFSQMAFNYEQYGAAAVIVEYNESHNKIVSLPNVTANQVRAVMPKDGTEIKEYLVQRFFGPGSYGLENNKPSKYPKFSVFNKKDRKQLLYVKNPHSGNPIYGVPNYVSAYDYISSDYEFGRMINTSSANSFAPKLMATFIGRNMTEEQKREQFDNFKDTYLGNDGEQVVAAWVRDEKEKPIIEPLKVENLDKTVAVMAQLNDSKILTAHNVPSPTLFGVMVSGKLGGTGNELVTAFQIFRATETLPTRELLLDKLSEVMRSSGKIVTFTVEEEEINLESIKGANTEDVNPKDSETDKEKGND
jgi:hypothetical protein